ncbi:DUF2690 domain-containing protein [Streptomyces sp. NPDC054794]
MLQPPAPATPDEPLAARLRELKDRSGLSLAALAARTPYSKSAWHRYLTGGQPPPRSAVEALARIADADPAPVLALWEACEGAPGATPSGTSAEVPSSRARSRRLPLLALLTVATAAAAALALSARHGAPRTQDVVAAPRCHGPSCQGQLPDVSVCARDARTESTVTDTGYDVRLRYSPACGAAWSEVRMRSPHTREISVRKGEQMLSATYPADDAAGYTSPMLAVPSAKGVEACAEVDGELACTGLDAEESAAQP